MDPALPTASTLDLREPISADRVSFPAGTQSMRIGYTPDTEAQEDWLSVATADPAFWLKRVDR